jgi:hypothetical protein
MECGLCSALAADRADDLLTIKQASVGFGGKFKAGFWQPVRLTVAAGSAGAKGRLELVVPDGDQMPVVYRDARRGGLDLGAGQEQSLLLYAKSGPIATPLTVQLRGEGGVLWSREIARGVSALRSTQELVVGLGPPVGLADAAGMIHRRADSGVQTAVVEGAAELPDRWWGYEGVDCLVLTTSDPDFIAALRDEQQQAIVQWVLMGGRIIVCVGARGAEMAAGGSSWAPLIPGTFAEVAPLRERSGLEGFTKSELPFDDPLFQRNRPSITRLTGVRGEVLLDEVSSSALRPLAVHAPAGLGEVIFVGFDLDHPSLKTWKGRPRLLAALLQRGGTERDQSDRELRRSVTHLGYEDLIGQLRAALDQFSGVSLVNFTTVSMLTAVYLLLIGPGDFLLLSRLGLPRHLTWLTFPVMALATIAVAGVMNGQVHGRRVRVNQAEVIDIDLEQQVTRGTVWCHLYSPATRQYGGRLHVAAPQGVATTSPEGWIAWQGLPGDSLGGLESRQPTLLRREPYSVALEASPPEFDGLTVQVASSKCLLACWWSKTNLPNDARLSMDRYGLLAGEFRQPLDVKLADCLLAQGEKLYRLGNLAPGQSVRLADLPPLNLEARLTERRVEQSKDVSTPWEQDSVDIPRIMQMLMFHDAARGTNYTGLTHRYQAKIDLSEHVRLGRAVLVGRAIQPLATIAGGDSNAPLASPDDTNTWTWYRIVLPVNNSVPGS